MIRPRALVSTIIAALTVSVLPASIHAQSRRPAPHVYDVEISPSAQPAGATSVDIGSDAWTLEGYDLRGILAKIYDMDPARIRVVNPEIAASGADATDARYDVHLALRGTESEDTIRRIVGEAIEKRFHLEAAMATRDVSVLVLTAPRGAGSGLETVAISRRVSHGSQDDAEMAPETITISGQICPTVQHASISAKNATVHALGRALEAQLERVVVDETNLKARYNFNVPEFHNQQELATLLHSSLGLDMAEAQRKVNVLDVYSDGTGISETLEAHIAVPDPQPEAGVETASLR